MSEITVIGGGVAGLTAAITCAEGGASVRLLLARLASSWITRRGSTVADNAGLALSYSNVRDAARPSGLFVRWEE